MSIPYESHNIKKKFVEMMHKTYGNITLACKNAGIARTTYYDWYRNDEAFKALCDEAKDIALDFVENQLFVNIGEKDTASICFYLKTQGKRRGYIERTETSNKDSDPFKHEHIFDINKYSKETIDALNRIKEEG